MTGEFILENGIIAAYQRLDEETPKEYKNHHEYEHAAAYELLDEMLSKHFGISYNDFSINRLSGGKPYFEGTSVQFNVSHCRKMAACAASLCCPVGIDVECVRNVKENILKRVFSEKESAAYEKSHDKNNYFFRAWTFKESQAKLSGKGIGQDLRLLDYEAALCLKDNGASSLFMQWVIDTDIIISLSYGQI
jgi:phosphopantetheine--protein transferase-like protein